MDTILGHHCRHHRSGGQMRHSVAHLYHLGAHLSHFVAHLTQFHSNVIKSATVCDIMRPNVGFHFSFIQSVTISHIRAHFCLILAQIWHNLSHFVSICCHMCHSDSVWGIMWHYVTSCHIMSHYFTQSGHPPLHFAVFWVAFWHCFVRLRVTPWPSGYSQCESQAKDPGSSPGRDLFCLTGR